MENQIEDTQPEQEPVVGNELPPVTVEEAKNSIDGHLYTEVTEEKAPIGVVPPSSMVEEMLQNEEGGDGFFHQETKVEIESVGVVDDITQQSDKEPDNTFYTEKISEQPSMNDIASKHLGSGGSYAVYTEKFDASLLVPMPRNLARKDWGITGEEFVGFDTWTCHEATFLTDSGMPVAGTLKVIYPSSSEFMVESKSMKLYLNTFDMCKMGDTIRKAKKNYQLQVAMDLTRVLGVPVQARFFDSLDYDIYIENPVKGYKDMYPDLVAMEGTFEIDDYQASKQHLEFHHSYSSQTYRLYTNVLRSRCRHTKQKDTGSAYIYIKTKQAHLHAVSLFKQIVSLREVNEFHEFCAEKLYTDIMNTGQVEECCVMLLYSRRGSLDINPVRATRVELIPQGLIDINVVCEKTQGQ